MIPRDSCAHCGTDHRGEQRYAAIPGWHDWKRDTSGLARYATGEADPRLTGEYWRPPAVEPMPVTDVHVDEHGQLHTSTRIRPVRWITGYFQPRQEQT